MGVHCYNKRSTLKHVLIELKRSVRKDNCRCIKWGEVLRRQFWRIIIIKKLTKVSRIYWMSEKVKREETIDELVAVQRVSLFKSLNGQKSLWNLSVNNVISFLLSRDFFAFIFFDHLKLNVFIKKFHSEKS